MGLSFETLNKTEGKERSERDWRIRRNVTRGLLKQIEIVVSGNRGKQKLNYEKIKIFIFLAKDVMCFRYYILVLQLEFNWELFKTHRICKVHIYQPDKLKEISTLVFHL